MNSTLNIKLVEKRKLFYDLGPIGFHFAPPITIGLIISYLALNGYNFYNVCISGILIYFISHLLLFRKMYGWWLVNYIIIGNLEFTDNSLCVKKNHSNSIYFIKELNKI